MKARSLTLFAIGALALGACAPKDAPPPPPPPAPNVVTVRASDFAYDIPATVPAGMTTFKLVNAGPNLHHMIVARIDSGKTFADAAAAFAKPGPPPAWLTPVGGPNVPEPNAETNGTLDLQAGEYVVFCMVDIPGGVPHVAKGMLKQLTVTPATGAPAAAPVADVTLTLKDYQFQFSKPLTAGAHTIEIIVAPGQPHEFELVKLAPGKTMNDFMKEMEAIMKGGPPPATMSGTAIGGMAPGVAGTKQYFTVDLTPGEYFLICFLPDAKDGKMHFEHGMMQQITVN
jgi:uncharacterized cupredoxin-like copper-binding protein